MKHRPPSRLLRLLDSYGILLVSYLILRVLIGSRWWWLGLFHTFALWLFVPLLPIMALALLWRGRRTAQRALMVFLFGMLTFAPFPIGWLTASNDDHDLRVLTYNVYNQNQRMGQTVGWILAQDADVLILQELVDDNLAVQLPRLLEQYPYRAHVVGNVQIFSRLPIIESNTITLQDIAPTRDGRLAIRAVIDVDGHPVTIYGVHLNIPFDKSSERTGIIGRSFIGFLLRYDETIRNQQWHTLTTLVAAESNPVIVGGDFNTSHTSPITDLFRDIGMTDAFKAVGTGWGMTWSNKPPNLPLLRIDYLWSSEQLTPLRLTMGDFIGEYGSDHLPIVVDYTLR